MCGFYKKFSHKRGFCSFQSYYGKEINIFSLDEIEFKYRLLFTFSLEFVFQFNLLILGSLVDVYNLQLVDQETSSSLGYWSNQEIILLITFLINHLILISVSSGSKLSRKFTYVFRKLLDGIPRYCAKMNFAEASGNNAQFRKTISAKLEFQLPKMCA